jgi:hypothetical protein
MNQLLTIANVVLSENIGTIEPADNDAIEVINQTLDGQSHVQIIGAASKSVKFETLSSNAQVDLINNLRATGAKFKLVKETTVYTGLLLDKPTWKRITKEYYFAVLKLNILEEGTL